MNTREYDTKMRTQSAARIEQGSTPHVRMAAPTLFVPELETVVISLDEATKRLNVNFIGVDVQSGEQSHARRELVEGGYTPQRLATLMTKSDSAALLFADRFALEAATRPMLAIGTAGIARAGRIIQYLSEQSAMSRCAVLTRALAQKFWSPEDVNPHRLSTWATLFGLNDESVANQIRSLSAKVKNGTTEPLRNPLFQISSKTAVSLMFGGHKYRVQAFNAMQNHSDAWEAMCGADQLLYERGLLIGSTARITPIERDGVSVTAQVTTPFKLRAGGNIMLFGGTLPSGRSVRLASLDFNDATNSLIARIERTAKKSNLKPGEQDGFFYLADESAIGQSFYAINEPFLMGNNQNRKIGSRAINPRTRRELPLDVSLAGTPTES